MSARSTKSSNSWKRNACKHERPTSIGSPGPHRAPGQGTSIEAAQRITDSGVRGRQHREVLELVTGYPKCTSRELAKIGQMDRYVVARRLPELERAGLVRKCGARICGIGDGRAVTWEAI